MDETAIYTMIGEDGFIRLVAAFYRQVPGDAILGKMYPPHELGAAEKRLRDFLMYRRSAISRSAATPGCAHGTCHFRSIGPRATTGCG
jgi:hemoglobin